MDNDIELGNPYERSPGPFVEKVREQLRAGVGMAIREAQQELAAAVARGNEREEFRLRDKLAGLRLQAHNLDL